MLFYDGSKSKADFLLNKINYEQINSNTLFISV